MGCVVLPRLRPHCSLGIRHSVAIILTSRPLSELRLDVAIISDVQHAYSVVLMPER